ncbi:MAG: DUF1080 domain-containing protein [Planctomycetota bacterium]
MKTSLPIAIVALMALLPPLSARGVHGAKVQQIFNGKNLDGWSGDPRLWSVNDGCLVGSTVDHKIETNTFLVWQGAEVTDFRLNFKAKVVGDNNSGVQYRSKLIDAKNWRVVGYQADINANPEYVAMLYSEGTGRSILATRGTKAVLESDPKQGKSEAKVFSVAPIDVAQWHEFSIIARGNHLVHQLDGETTIDVVDNHDDKALRGILALQLHAGQPMTVYFKDMELETLEASAQVGK